MVLFLLPNSWAIQRVGNGLAVFFELPRTADAIKIVLHVCRLLT